MAFPNLIALIGLRHIVIEETKNYFVRLKNENVESPRNSINSTQNPK